MMNALEYFTDIDKQTGIVDSGEEVMVILPSEDSELTYFRMYAEDGHYVYEYLTLIPRGNPYDWLHGELVCMLDGLPIELQYEVLMGLEKMELESEPNWNRKSVSCTKYPLYSVRGTCNMEKECRREPLCCKVHDEPCCFNKRVGCSAISAIKDPCYDEYIPEFIAWLALCPDMDVLYVMHDFVPVYYEDGELYFEFAFLLKDGKFTYIDDKEEVKRLYEEYHEKYPCDTSEVEDMMNSGNDCVSDFHF